MTPEIPALIDRRRLKRRLFLWRFIAIVALFAALGLLLAETAGDDLSLTRTSQIARVSLTGFISDDRKQQQLLRKIARAKHVKALVLRINSPGGTTTGSEALFEAIRAVAAKKPVVAVMGTVAASGGYAVALAADHIVARGNTITGSIGVIVQWPELEDLLAKIGVNYREVKSSPLKASPSPYHTPDEQSLAIMRAMVRDSHDWFIRLVADRRKMDMTTARRLGDGRIYTGRQALAEKLVDAIGGEKTARSWLEKTRKIDRNLKVVDWKTDSLQELAFSRLALSVAGAIPGLKPLTDLFDRRSATYRPNTRLDGLLSIWHPETR